MKSSVAAAKIPALRMPSKAASPWILIDPERGTPAGISCGRVSPMPIITSFCITERSSIQQH